MNARVLACACSLPRRAPLKLRNAAEWTSALAAQQPAGIDWPDRLRTQAHVIAEIGRPPFLHTNACDFLLMHRDLWRNLRGYPKAAISNESLDALLCYSAHFAGASEEILRPPMLLVRNRAVARHPIPHDLEWLIGEMRRFRTPVILDPEPWRAA